jgi:biopolymer transport protein ExbD
VSVPVNLPSSSAPPKPPTDKPLFLTLKADLDLYLGDNRIDRPALAAELDRATKRDRTTPVFVRADKTVAYGDLMAVMDALRVAGYLKVVLVGLETLGGT